MTHEEAIRVLEDGDWWLHLDEWYEVANPEHDRLHNAIDMAIAALQEQRQRANQFRVPSEEEWMETYCTPKQLAGYQQKKNA